MAIKLPELPYGKNELAPHISANTIDFHYGKHHNTYVVNLSKLIEGTELEDESLDNIIMRTFGDLEKSGVFNNAAQVWNHSFYWQCIKPDGGGVPTGAIKDKINADLGGYEKFAELFKNAGLTQFGSGWAWLILNADKLEIMKTPNADTPMAHGFKPLLTVDVWEHAYYLDYQNRRGDYLDAFLAYLVNWDFVSSQLEK